MPTIGPSRAPIVIPMKPLLTRTLLALAVVGGFLALRFTPVAAHVNAGGGLVRVEKTAMGTIWTIEAMDHGRSDDARRAISAAYSELERIEALMSEWRPQSPISQVDAAAGDHAVEVPAELRELIQRSIRYSEKTEGTFDITWRGMGNLWHFDDDFVPPTPAQVEIARRNIDYRAIKIEHRFGWNRQRIWGKSRS
jgi:FAD:protein FMN transferase